MTANELRIGNLFKEGEIDSILYSEQMRKCEVINKNNARSFVYIELLTPIPLTEDWLLKFGAVRKNDRDGAFDLFGYNIYMKCDNPIFFGQEGCCQTETIRDGIQYVHQLQNLYQALTGEELTLK